MKNHIEITNFNDPNLDLYARLSEVQLLRYAEPKPGIFVAESPKVIGRALQAGYGPISFLVAHRDMDREAVEILERWDEVPVYTAEDAVLRKLTGFAMTRGMLCAMRRREIASVKEVCRGARRITISGKCCESDECGSYLSLGGGASHGCRTSDRRVQRSALSPGGESQYGNGISDSVDVF